MIIRMMPKLSNSVRQDLRGSTMMLEAGPIPLYFQIKNIIKSKILSNELRGQERLPSEAQLCQQYHVSLGTLRQAISELIREGFVYRVRGKGTFVTEVAGLRRLRYKGTIENLIASAEEGRIRVLEYKEVVPPPHVSKLFSLEIHQNVFQLEVIFSTPKGPSRCSLIYFPPELGKMIRRYDLRESTDIILLVENKLQTKIHHAHQTMQIRLADQKVAKYLSVKQRTPIFFMERHYLAKDGSPIFMSFNYCRPDLYEFKIELTRN
jgi:GntR family transcriptional regulator